MLTVTHVMVRLEFEHDEGDSDTEGHSDIVSHNPHQYHHQVRTSSIGQLTLA
jgi:hypothetical protein